MAILRNDTVVKSADGQHSSAIITASNIGSYGVATNSTYYIGTTQNVFNRASGAQTLTGVSIDGNAATVTNGVYTTGTQTIGGDKTFSSALNLSTGGTSARMFSFYTNLTNTDDWTNSAVSIRERDLVGIAQSANTYSPNLNFHWGSRVSNSLWMDANGNLAWGSYSETGVPSSDGAFYAANLYASIYYDKNDTAYYLDAGNTGTSLLVAGKVGIGTTSPSQKLHVVGNIIVAPVSSAWAEGLSFTMPTTSTWGGLRWRREVANADGNHYVGYTGLDSTDDLVFGSNNGGTQINNNIRITKAGLVGIGTIPTQKFHVSGIAFSDTDFRAPIFYDSANTAYYLDPNNTGTSLNTAGAVVAGTYVYSTTYLQAGNNNIYPNGFANTLILNVGNSAGNNWITGISIAQGGNVGIGTTSPSNKTTIEADGTGASFADNSVGQLVIRGATNTAKRLGLGIDTTNNIGVIQAQLYGTGQYSLVLNPAGGNVGIGNTSPSAKLHVSGASYTTASAANNNVRFEGGGGNGLGFGTIDATSTYASWIQSGYVPNFATATYALLLNPLGGNVGIGTTSPSQKLHVVGTGFASADFRAPIFYDSDNTAYYIDAASTSNLNVLVVAASARVGGAASRSTSGLTVGFTDNSTFAANSDVGDTDRMLSIVNESSTTNAMSVLGFRVNPNGGTANAMLDVKFVQTGATNTSALHYTFNHGGTFADRFSILSSGNVGIGTTSPTQILDVRGNIKLGGDNSGNYVYYIKDNEGSIVRTTRSDVSQEGLFRSDGWGNFTFSNNIGVGLSLGTGYGVGSVGTGIIYANGSVRAPIFYDSSNTAYYCDPASTSNLAGLTVANTITGSISGNAGTVTNGVYITGNQSIAGNKTFTGITSFTNASDYQISLNGSGTTWAGIEWVDTNGTDYMWYNGQNKTFAIGGGGSNISGKKLHVDGGVTIGADYDSTVVPANGLSIQGAIQIGDYYIFPINSLSSSATQARTFEIARIGIDFNDWNNIGTFEVELHESYYSRGLKKVYNIWYGYTSNSGIRLVEWRGNGDNNFQCRIGSQVLVSGDHYYLPIFVDVRNYGIVDVVVKTNRLITTNTTPAIGYTYVNTAPTATNITDFTADSDLEISTLGTAKLGGNTILTSSNYSGYSAFSGSVTSTYGNFASPGLIMGDAQYGFYVVSGNVYYKSASGGVHYWRNIANSANTMSLDNSGSLNLAADVRAPIFYDSGDTTYYVDPAGTSRVNTLYVANVLADSASGNGRILLYGNLHIDAYGANDIYCNYYSGRRFRTFKGVGTGAETFRADTDGIVYAYEQLRTPILYDHNDTNYYLNPASSSVLNTLSMAGTITGALDATASFTGGVCTAASYNYVLNGANDTGNKLVIFINGSSRTADGGVNALTIRNDGGTFVLGSSSYLTSILGSSVTINGNAALTSASTLTAGNLSGTIPSGVLGNSTLYVGTTAIALNRGSASQSLTGVNIDGSSGSCTGNAATVSYAASRTDSTTYPVLWGLNSGSTTQAYSCASVYIQSSTGNIYANGFYDAGNTAYYVDPASTSNLNNLTVAGTMTFGTLAYTTGSRRSKNSSNVNVETVTGLVSPSGPTFLEIRGFCPTTMYRTTGDRPAPYGLGFGNGSESGGIMPIGAGDNLQEIMLYGANSGPTTFTFKRQIWEGNAQDPDGSNYYGSAVFSINTGTGAVTASTDIRAPIFYDSNDTTYYTDPSSLSNILELKTNKNWYDSSASAWGGGINIGGNSPSIGFQSTSSTWWYMLHHSSDSINFYRRSTSGSWSQDCIWDNSGNFIWRVASIRAPIFYDFNNTAYYLDPASTSNLNALTVAGGNATIYRDLIVNGGASGNFGNRIIVQGTATTYTYQDTTFRPTVYLNGDYPVVTLNCSATTNANHGPTLQFAFNGLTTGGATSRQIVIGANGVGSWLDFGFSGGANGDNSSYNPHNGISGYSGVTAMRLFSNGLLVGSTGTYPNHVTSTSFALDVRGTGSSNTDFRAPIFYDSDNTSYYLNPAGNSQVVSIYANDWFRAQGNTGLYFQDKGYGITSAGAASNSYGNASTYGSGLNGWQGWGIGSRHCMMSNGGDNFGVHDNTRSWLYYWDGTYHRFQYGYLQSANSVRGPLFYDSDNTAYYCDPASTSNLNVITAAGNVTAAQYYTGGWFRNSTSGNGLYNESTAQHFYSDDVSYWNVASSSGVQGIRFRTGGHAGTVRGYVYANDSNDVGLLNNGGNWRIRVVAGDYTIFDGSSVRAQIFYDSNNTAYYIDGASTSNLNGLNIVDGNLELYKSQTIDMSNTTTYSTSNYYPVTISVPTEGCIIQIQNNLNSNVPSWSTHAAGFTLNLRWRTNGSGWGTTAVRRYIEQYFEQFTNQTICGGITQMGHSSTEVVWLRGGGQYYFKFSRNLSATAQSATYTVNSQSVSPTSTAQNTIWNSYSGGWVIYNDTTYSTSNMYTPVLYDYNNSAYYVDPASTSNLVGLTVANTITGSITGNAGGSSASCTGNAATATILQTARNINGTSFNGSAAITTATWGTARTITIGSTGKSVDGSANVSWSLAELGAAATNQTMFIGTTSFAINRASASQTLTGISIDGSSTSCSGNAATATTTDNINGRAFSNRDSGNGVGQDAYTNNGVGYVTGVSLFSQTDGGMYASAYSTSWVHQIYGDFRTGQIAIRGKNSGTWQAWRSVLDSSNYTSYAPTLTGTGASGSWGISVTGSSASCTGNAATVTNGMYLSGDQNISGAKYFTSNKGATSTVGANNTYSLEAFSSDAGAAGMSFHRGGYYAVNMGLDPDNVLRIGGWSASANRLQLDMSGNLTLAGVVDATQFRDSSNTAYYVDPAGTSNLNALVLSGASYFRPQTWIQMDGSYGMYWPNTNGCHIEGNTLSSYGSLAIRGTRGGWKGIHFYEGGNVPHLMFDGSANGGVYFESGGRWASYYSYGNNCWGFGTSTTNSAYNLYVGTGVYSGGRVDGTIFYDSNNTAYYIDAASTSILNLVRTRNTFGERIALNSASPQTIDTQYNVTELTLTSSILTLTFSNIQASGIVHMWTLVTVGNATVYTITWPAAVKWPGGTAPTLTTTSGKRDIYQFVTYDGGTNIYAIIVGQNL